MIFEPEPRPSVEAERSAVADLGSIREFCRQQPPPDAENEQLECQRKRSPLCWFLFFALVLLVGGLFPLVPLQ